VRLALLQGRFEYSDIGLLDRTHLHFYTLETVRELLTKAGLAIVETRRVIMPLFHTELGVQRETVSDATVDDLMADPEVEVYQFVMKAVLDDGTQAVTALSEQFDELADHVRHEEVRAALLRKELRDRDAEIRAEVLESERVHRDEQQRIIHEQQQYVEALEGHVSGLEHNIAELHAALAASDGRYRALLSTRSFRITAPLRWLGGRAARNVP
jgi:hypothetical protein